MAYLFGDRELRRVISDTNIAQINQSTCLRTYSCLHCAVPPAVLLIVLVLVGVRYSSKLILILSLDSIHLYAVDLSSLLRMMSVSQSVLIMYKPNYFLPATIPKSNWVMKLILSK